VVALWLLVFSVLVWCLRLCMWRRVRLFLWVRGGGLWFCWCCRSWSRFGCLWLGGGVWARRCRVGVALSVSGWARSWRAWSAGLGVGGVWRVLGGWGGVGG